MSKRWCYVVRFKIQGKGKAKAYRTMAKSPKQAASKLHKKGAIIVSVHKSGTAKR